MHYSPLLFFPLSLACLPLYVIWGHPTMKQILKVFIAALTEGKPEKEIAFMNRILIFTIPFDNLVKSPTIVVNWYLDEIFSLPLPQVSKEGSIIFYIFILQWLYT